MALEQVWFWSGVALEQVWFWSGVAVEQVRFWSGVALEQVRFWFGVRLPDSSQICARVRCYVTVALAPDPVMERLDSAVVMQCSAYIPFMGHGI